jgi:SAM-dependent methyltransferase
MAVEPSAAMRKQIPRRPGITVLEGDATALPLADRSADGAWLSLVLHHISDLQKAAREMRRVLRPGCPVLIRQGFPDRYQPIGDLRLDSVEVIRWFPETARAVSTFPTLQETCAAFAAAGFRQEAVEQVRETYPASLADFLDRVDIFRSADTTMRGLTDDEFRRGKERLRRAVQREAETGDVAERSNWLDLLVLR